ncbi:MAG TPA: 3-oxoacyl-[acyl-carrier-protein] synthase III C-terminal domain-containing protein [Rubricoccaceae bacterium]|nr:3-oxoacyl-[acyl-carrier-protein] synthase III C-terminal domain-containing protein [Rubricoccaceae bacterium]
MSPRAYVTARPLAFGHSVPQEEGIAWMKACLRRVAETRPVPGLGRALRFCDVLARTANIGARTTCLDDYTHQDWDRMRLHAAPPAGDGQAPAADAAEAPWYRPSLEARTEIFAETALALARDAFADDVEAPGLLVQVSCTGYDSPTAVQRLAVEKGWTAGTRLLHLGHMGCYAALPAVALAADCLPSLSRAVRARAAAGPAGDDVTGARAALFLVELCTLHHDPAATDVEQLVTQTLFADGAARVDVTAEPPAPGTRALAFLDHAEVLLPETAEAMTWRVADAYFRMTLSRDVPRHIGANLASAVEQLLAPHGLGVEDVAWWAVHPGGPRVIESAAEALGLPDAAVRHSQDVLYARGNMSSVTIPHVWAAMLADEAVAAGDLVVSLAFGPGLTVAMSLMRVA